jgi:hypothetical protein
MKSISSSGTFFVRRIWPYLWLFIGGAVGIIVFRLGALASGSSESVWIFLFILALSSLAFFWLASALKEVSMDSSALYVSFNHEEVRIPFSNIEYVGENFFPRQLRLS